MQQHFNKNWNKKKTHTHKEHWNILIFKNDENLIFYPFNFILRIKWN